jgi:hypothetical protein
MLKQLKGFYLMASSVVITLLHLPFAFAKSASSLAVPHPTPAPQAEESRIAPLPMPAPAPIKALPSAYDSLRLQLRGLSSEAFEYAKKGFTKLVQANRLANDSIISIIDFTQSSSEKRLFILDLKNYKLLFNTLVAHGRNTGTEWATQFSNMPSSYKSSPGFYITGETYSGTHGLSLKLDGIETGINDQARDRAIVMHGAHYVNDSWVNNRGYIGRSEGCPAVPEHLSKPIISTIKGGSCLFIYHPSYVKRSAILRS